jgi:hypothetical protein
MFRVQQTESLHMAQNYEPRRKAPSTVRNPINDLAEVESWIEDGPESGAGVPVVCGEESEPD